MKSSMNKICPAKLCLQLDMMPTPPPQSIWVFSIQRIPEDRIPAEFSKTAPYLRHLVEPRNTSHTVSALGKSTLGDVDSISSSAESILSHVFRRCRQGASSHPERATRKDVCGLWERNRLRTHWCILNVHACACMIITCLPCCRKCGAMALLQLNIGNHTTCVCTCAHEHAGHT